MDITRLQARADELCTVPDDELEAGLGELADQLEAEGLTVGKKDRDAVEAQMADLRREVEEDKQAKKDHQAWLDQLSEQVRREAGSAG